MELNKRLLGNGASGDVLGNLLVIRRDHRQAGLELMLAKEPVGGQYDSVYPYSSSPVDTADLDAVISVAETGRTYKRNGIFQNSQDGNEVDGAVKVSLCASLSVRLLNFI